MRGSVCVRPEAFFSAYVVPALNSDWVHVCTITFTDSLITVCYFCSRNRDRRGVQKAERTPLPRMFPAAVFCVALYQTLQETGLMVLLHQQYLHKEEIM